MFRVRMFGVSASVLGDTFSGDTLKSLVPVNRIVSPSFPRMNDGDKALTLGIPVFKKPGMPSIYGVDQVFHSLFYFLWIRAALVQTPKDKSSDRWLGDAAGGNRTTSRPNIGAWEIAIVWFVKDNVWNHAV